MDDAWLGLVGVGVGVVGTLAATLLTSRSSEKLAAQARSAQRGDAVRELAAEAYVAAVEAIQWLSSMHVEDAADPKFAEEYVPRTATAMASLQTARQAITKAVALGGGESLSRITSETSDALTVLADSWEAAKAARVRILAASPGKMLTFHKSQFNRENGRLQASRLALVGFDGNDLPRDEIDQGSVLPGSLLFRLREATAAT